MPDPREPKLTKRQRGELESVAAKNQAEIPTPAPSIITRRRLIIGLGSALGLTAVTATGLALTQNWAPAQGNSSGDFPRFLDDLNTRTLKNPTALADGAPELVDRTRIIVSTRMGYAVLNRDQYIVHSDPNQFHSAVAKEQGCLSTGPDTTSLADSFPESGLILVNLRTHLKGSHPAYDLAESLIHEPYHIYAQPKPFTEADKALQQDPNIQYTQRHGLKLRFRVPLDNQGKICWGTQKQQMSLDEAVIAHEALQTMIEQGVEVGPGKFQSRAYPNLRQRYVTNFVASNFARDHRVLLLKQQESDPLGFHQLVGVRLFKNNPNPVHASEDHVYSIVAGPN